MRAKDDRDWPTLRLYVIWSFDHEAWWRPNERGYTRELAEAGRYTGTHAGQLATDDVMLNTLPVLLSIAERRGPPTHHPYGDES